MSSRFEFTKDNLDKYLKELAKEYRKLNGKAMPAEITLIGGASVLINYGFRNSTSDMDAIIKAASSMKDAINTVRDRNDLPNGWLNDDFMRTASYTPKIEEFSKYYHTYSNIVTFRTIDSEYLIAMKLRSGRKYKFDRSDVIGILWSHDMQGDPITLERIRKAVTDLYGSYDVLPDYTRSFVEDVIQSKEYEELYLQERQLEIENRQNLAEYEKISPGVLTQSNANDIIEAIRKRKQQK